MTFDLVLQLSPLFFIDEDEHIDYFLLTTADLTKFMNKLMWTKRLVLEASFSLKFSKI